MAYTTHQTSLPGARARARAITWPVVTLAIVLTLAVTLTEACKPERSDTIMTMDFKMMRSDVMAYGYPRRRLPDPHQPGSGYYVIDFEVRCIFKGAPLDEMVRIYNVGSNDSQCQRSEMPVDTPLVIYLSKQGQRFEPTYREDPGEQHYLDEIPAFCGVTVSYPIGYSEESNKEQCVEEYPYEDDCLPTPTDPPSGDDEEEEEEDNNGDEKTKEVTYTHDNDGKKGKGQTKGKGIQDGADPEEVQVGAANENNSASRPKSVWVVSLVALALFLLTSPWVGV